jgi:hypothetical protein
MNVTIEHHEMRITLDVLTDADGVHLGVQAIECQGEFLPVHELADVLKAERLAIELKAIEKILKEIGE